MSKFILRDFINPKKELEQYFVRISDNEDIFNYLKRYLKDLDVEDWCAGTGAFSLDLSVSVKSIICIEIDIDAVSILRKNISENKITNVSVLHLDVLKHQPAVNHILINPPFGKRTKLLLPILKHLSEMNVANIMIILPIKELGVAKIIFSEYKVIYFKKWDLSLSKTYQHHESENYQIQCGFAHFQKNSDVEESTSYIEEMRKVELDAYLIYNEMIDDLVRSEIKQPKWLDYLQDDSQENRDIPNSNLIGIRVGYVLYNTFNGRLQFYIDAIDKKIIITLSNDIDMSLKTDQETVHSVNKLIKMILDNNDDFNIELSELLKSTVNETFVITKCMPNQPLSRYVGCIHPWVTFVCAITAFFCCLVSWPNDMNVAVRKLLCNKLMPSMNPNTIDYYFSKGDESNLLKFIQDCINEMHGDIITEIVRKMQTLTTSEISLFIKQVPDLEWTEYLNFIRSETEEIELPNVSTLVRDLTNTVKKVVGIYDSYENRRHSLEEYISDLNRVHAIINSHKLSMSDEELRKYLRETKEFLSDNNELINAKDKQIIQEAEDKSKRIRESRKIPTVLQETMSDPFLPDFTRRLNEESEYNINFRELRSVIKIAIKAAKSKLHRFEVTDNILIEELIDKYFTERNLYKRVSKSGNIKSMKSVSSLLSYIFNMIAIYDQDETFTNEDRMQLEGLREKLYVVMREGENIPVQQLIQSSRLDFTGMEAFLPESARNEFLSLLYQLNICSNYNQAWSISLRMKGLLYEAFFSKSWNLIYVPEDLKHTLLTIIRQMFPNLVDTFLTRTNSHPEIRELKPDFCIVRKPILTEGISDILNFKKEKNIFELDNNSTIDESQTISRSVLFESAGRYNQMHELGSDEVIIRKTADDKFFATIKNLVDYAKEKNAQGGLISSNIKIKNTNEDSTVQIDSDEENEELELDEQLDELFNTNSDNLSSEEFKESISSKDSVKSSWKDYEDFNIDTSEEIAVIEVGYQTDQEGKIASDLNKWKPALQVLESLGLKLTVISAVDKTSQPPERWWIKKEYVQKLKSSISRLFSKLAMNSPIDVSEHIIGDISSQKIRLSLRSGNIVRPPILSSDIYKYYISNRDRYIIRPTGIKLPSSIESDFIQSLVFGCNINSDLNYLNTILDHIADNSDVIIDSVKSSNSGMTQTSDTETMLKFNFGRLLEEFEMAVCTECFNKVKTLISTFPIVDKISVLAFEMQQDNKCLNCVNIKSPSMSLSKCNSCNFDTIITNPMKILQNKLLIQVANMESLVTVPTTARYIQDQQNDQPLEIKDSELKHPFDRFININIPLRSQKLKRLNNLKKLIIDLLLINNNLKSYKDQKGQIFVCTKVDTLHRDLSILDANTHKKLIKIIRSKNKIVDEESEGLVLGNLDKSTGNVDNDSIEPTNNGKEEEVKSYCINLSDISELSDLDTIIMNLLDKLIELGDDLSSYSIEIIQCQKKNVRFIAKPKSVICEEWLNNLIKGIKLEKSTKELVDKIITSQSKYENYTEVDDRMPKLDQYLTTHYMDTLRTKLLKCEVIQFSTSCILFEPVIIEVKKRLQGTVYEISTSVITQLIKLMCNFNWFQEIILYSKICQLFLVFCSEFSHSGIKTRKIPHTSLNLVVKIPEKKTSNMQCWICDSDFNIETSSSFFLNRRVATLGQSLPYCYLVVILQVLQMTHSSSELMNFDDAIIDTIADKSKDKFTIMKSLINKFNCGNVIESVETFLEFMNSRVNYNTDKSTIKEVFIETISSLNLSLGCLLGPAICLNSQSFNKYIQTVRYPYMLSLSEFGFEIKLGKKMTCPRRRIEVELAKSFTNLVCSVCLHKVRQNIPNWKTTSWCPPTSLTSLILPFFPVLNDRHFVFDIYLVHIYNKELDDFGSGQIRVLDEFAEKHMTWENELDINIKMYKESKTSKERSKYRMKICLLLGIANLSTKKYGRDCLRLLREIYQGDNQRVYENSDKNTKEEDDKKSLKSEDSNNSTSIYPKSLSKSMDFYRTNLEFYYKSSGTYTVNIGKGLRIERGPHTGLQEVVSPVNTKIIYKVTPEYLTSSILDVITNNPNHSYASFELIQLFTELSKCKYNPGVIDRSRKSKKNWASITNIIETTSIISEPVLQISLKEAIKSLKRQFTKKVTKLIKSRFDHSKDVRSLDQKKEMIDYLVDNFSRFGPVNAEYASIIKDSLVDTNRLEMDSWTNILKKPINETLLSTNMNQLYYWIKSLSRSIKNIGDDLDDAEKDCMKKYLLVISNVIKSETFNPNEVQYWLSQDEVDQVCSIENKKYLTLIKKLKINLEILKNKDFINEFSNLLSKCDKLREQKKKYDIINFRDEEHELQFLEADFVNKYQSMLLNYLNFLFVSVFVSSWSRKLENSSLGLLHFSLIKEINMEDKNQTSEYKHSIKVLRKLVLNYASRVENHFKSMFAEYISIEDTLINHVMQELSKFICTLFITNELPFKYVYIKNAEPQSNMNLYSKLLSDLKMVLAQSDYENTTLDLYLSTLTIKSRNFQSARRLMSRSGTDKIPRSTRSKVLFELIKLVKEKKQVILQPIAFNTMCNDRHINFASLAPKAQLGGDRDLLVQETGTKLIHATSELHAKSLLEHSSTDALTNPKVKEDVLESLNEIKKTANLKHGNSSYMRGRSQDTIVDFFRVYTCAKDHKKWGPIHCCSTFSASDQQLLSNHHDWNNFRKLVNIRNLIKSIEIPSSSIEKLLRSFTYSNEYKEFITKHSHDKNLSDRIIEFGKKWSWKPYIIFLVNNYISKGHVHMVSYNHMGQGIHHAESSRFADSIRVGISECCIRRFRRKFPTLTLEIKSVGSSDDLTMAYIISGTCSKDNLSEMEAKIQDEIENLECLWIALSRACQMSISEKSVISSCVNELYSDFDLYHKITPSVIKFIISTLINSTVSSPLTLYQSVHVSSQQAFYMSTPYITNLAFCLFRQQIYYNHSEDFFRSYGLLLFGGISCLCRLYVPKLSTLLTNALDLEDLERTIECLSLMSKCLDNMQSSKAILAKGSKKLQKKVNKKVKLLSGKQLSVKDKVQLYIDSLGVSQDENAQVANKRKMFYDKFKISEGVEEIRNLVINTLTSKNTKACLEDKEIKSRIELTKIVIMNRFASDNYLNLAVSRITSFDEKIAEIYKYLENFKGKDKSEGINIPRSIQTMLEEITGTSDTDDSSSSEEDLSKCDSVISEGAGAEIIATVDEFGKQFKLEKLSPKYERKIRKFEKLRQREEDNKMFNSDFEKLGCFDNNQANHDHMSYKDCMTKCHNNLKSLSFFNNLISKLKEQDKIINVSELSLEIVRSKLVCSFLNCYDFMKNYENSKITKANINDMHKGSFEDPFIYLLPESVKHELNKLNLFKGDIIMNTEDQIIDSDPARTVSINLVESSVTTESYEGEYHRCEQILRSKGIINSLSGGLKQESLPIMRMLLRSYQFNNKFGILFKDHWLDTKDSTYIAASNNISKPLLRVKFSDVLEFFINCPMSKLDDSSISTAYNLHNILFNASTDTGLDSPEMCLINPHIMTITLPRGKHFFSEEKIGNIITEYLDLVEKNTEESLVMLNRDVKEIRNREEEIITKLRQDHEKEVSQGLLFDTKSLLRVKNSIDNLLGVLTNFNRIQLIKAEQSPTNGFLQTGDVNVIKTRIFSRDSDFVLQNNLGVVAAHIIDPLGATERKPIGVNYAYLESDKNTLTSYYPVIGQIGRVLNDHTKNIKRKDVKKITGMINNICRSVNNHNQSATPFYAFKPSKIRQEDTTLILVQFNIIEGLELLIDSSEPYGITFSDKYYKFCECVSIINNLPIDESKKTKLFIQLLHWSPKLCTELISSERGDIVCNDNEIEKEIKDMYSSEPFYTQLMTESKKAKSERLRRQIMNLSNLVINPSQLILESQKSDLSLLFKVEGDPYSNGRYQLSCQYGNSVGIFINGKLCITLDSMSLELLNVTEIEIIKWCFGLRTDIVSIDQHHKFLNLLTNFDEVKGIIKSGIPKSVVIKNDEEGYGLRFIDVKPNEHVLFIKHGIITNRRYNPEKIDRSPLLKWNKDHLLIYISDETVSLKESIYFKSVINIMRELEENSDKIRNLQYLKEQRIIIDKIPLSRHISMDTIQLMHMFFWHISELPDSLNINRKRALKKLVSNTSIRRFRESAIDMKSKQIIEEYSRYLRNDEEVDLIMLQQKKEIIDKYKITPIVDIDSIYSLDEDGIKYVDPITKTVKILGENSKNYEELYKILKYKKEVKNKTKLKSGILTLPEEIPLDILKVLTDQLNDQNYSIRLKEVQFLINRHFKDISSWPYIKLLLDELNMSSLSITPSLNIVDKDLKWQLNFEFDSMKTPVPKDIVSILRQARSGTIPAEFSISCVTSESVTQLKDNIDKINEYMTLLKTNDTVINLFIVLLLYFDEIRFDLSRVSYNWLPFLNTVLPCKINLKNHSFQFLLIGRMMILKLNLFIAEPTLCSIKKDAMKELEKQQTKRLQKLEQLDKLKNRKSKKQKKKIQEAIDNLKLEPDLSEITNIILTNHIKKEVRILEESEMVSIIDNIETAQTLSGISYTFTLNRYYITRTYSDSKFLQMVTGNDTNFVEYMIAFTYLILNTLFRIKIDDKIQPFIDTLLEQIAERKEKNRLLKQIEDVDEEKDNLKKFMQDVIKIPTVANLQQTKEAIEDADKLINELLNTQDVYDSDSGSDDYKEEYNNVNELESGNNFLENFEAMLQAQLENVEGSSYFGSDNY